MASVGASLLSKRPFLIAKCKPLIAKISLENLVKKVLEKVLEKVLDGVGHPENKTSFVGFVYSRVGGSPVVTEVAYNNMHMRAMGTTQSEQYGNSMEGYG